MQNLLTGLAEILELPSVTPETSLGTWDSLCVVMTIALLDDYAGALPVDGALLSRCTTVGEVLVLAGEKL